MSTSATKAVPRTRNRFVARLFVAPQFLASYTRRLAAVQLLQGKQAIVTIIFRGTFFVVSLLLILLSFSFFVAGNAYVANRIFLCLGAVLYLVCIKILIHRAHIMSAAWMLIALYVGLASLILLMWSINAPIGILVLGFIIVLAGVMLGARYIIPVTIVVIGLLSFLQLASRLGIVHPDYSSLAIASGFGDVVSYSTIFAVFALISWLSGRQMEQSLQKALVAEAALQSEKDLLAVRLEEQTRYLRESQLEEMRQLYRFAELGQQSTALLHELANHLTVLTLDIDDIQQRNHRTKAISHARESITHLDNMVGQVRHQLQETSASNVFNILTAVDEVVTNLSTMAAKVQVSLHYKKPTGQKAILGNGDALRLSQILTIIITNAIEAYGEAPTSFAEPTVFIATHITQTTVEIMITDDGQGIPDNIRQQLFTPFQSSKKNGMGIGLFIAKSMIETHFKGTISLDPSREYTRFIITLPRYSSKGR